MHMVITNAVNRDPYPIDTLLLFMANMAWNSTMNTSEVREMLARKDERGEYAIPFLVVVDAFQSETVNFADLVLPDTTYLERYDAISLLDRPISEPDAAGDAIRHPVIELDRDVRPWQDVLVELASRLKFPVFTAADGARKFRDYKDFIVNYEKFPGIGFLAGWRGVDGESHLRGAPNPKQWEKYVENQSFFSYPWPDHMRYYRFANKDYLGIRGKARDSSARRPSRSSCRSIRSPCRSFASPVNVCTTAHQRTQAATRSRQVFDPLPSGLSPGEARTADEYPFTRSPNVR